MPDKPPATLRLRVDTGALAANWRALDALSGKAAAGAAVKADGYGLGVDLVVPALRDAGCRDFFVAHWSEVEPVADHVDPQSISVLHGPLGEEDVRYAHASGAKPVINSVPQARRWLDASGGPCDLMVDTGINRLGLPMAEIGDEAIGRLDIDLLMSHLASADEDIALNEAQCARWNEAKAALDWRRSSLANSAGIVLGQAFHGELTRPGLSLYGGIPRRELADRVRPVAMLECAIMQVRDIAPGEGVGYNSVFVAERPMRVATVALGYADGFLRAWTGKGSMTSNGRNLPILGRVSMDMTVVDIGNAADLREGDWLQVAYDLPEASAATGLSQYELLTLLGDRFDRAKR